MGYTSMEFTSMGHTSIELKKSKLFTGLICVLNENYMYAQKLNLEVKQIFV